MSKEGANKESADKPAGDRFDPEGWFTERTYSSKRFAPLPNGPGLYVLLDIDISARPFNYKVLYVGMSRNLSKRFNNHEIYQALNRTLDVFVYFKPHSEALRESERSLIKQFNPPYNLQHRERGL